MKRAGRILSLITLIVVLSTSLCFAGTLHLTETYPADGATGTAIENLGVKLYFDADLTAEKAGKINTVEMISLTGPEGENLPVRILYPEKEDGVVLVLFDNTKATGKDGKVKYKIESNSEYKLTIAPEFADDHGNTLGETKTVTFTTINQSVSTMVSMGMMFVMFGGMMIISTRTARKQQEEQNKKEVEERFNPYREAKRTGKSVEEVIAQHEREEAKKAKKTKQEEDFEWIDENTYRVKTKRTVAEGGSSYVTGRKALAEAKKAEEAARRAEKAAAKRNVKKGKGKKK